MIKSSPKVVCTTRAASIQEIGQTDLWQKVHLGTVRDNYRGLKIAFNDRQNKIYGYRVT